MKCPMCDGTGKSEIGVGAFTIHGADCDRCNGKGIIEPLTNEEWLEQASTEEKALFLARLYGHSRAIELSEMLFYNVGTRNVADVADYIGKWLKEEHE